MRSKDDSIYDKDKKFFSAVQKTSSDDDDDDDNDDGQVKKKRKPKLYKDLVREEVLEKMETDEVNANDDGDDDDDNDERNDSRARRNEDKMGKLAYDDEQKALRADFLKDEEDSDGEDDWLVKKKGNSASNGDVEKERLKEIEALASTAASNGFNVKDPKGEVENGDKFLMDFITNKRWVDQDDVDSDDDDNTPARPRIIGGGDDGNDSDSSLKALDRTDDFESRYNFRFEEANDNSGAGLSVVGYSRSALSDTIRRKDDSRKLKREQRKDRKATERKAKEERLKRLKNAKKEELEGRMNQIKAVLGEKGDEEHMGDDQAIDEEMVAKLMEGDFDPDKFEELMSKMYSDDFYQKEETEWKTDLDVKESLKKVAEEDGEGVLVNDEDEGGLYEDAGEEMADDGEYDEADDHEMEGEGEGEGGEKESTLDKKLKARMLDELYKLDYEDIIGDMPTRFKYRKVEANRYGLRPEEILFSRDTSLRQFVSLKRMAPYIDEGEYVPGSKKRRRFREMSKAEIEEDMQQYAPKTSKGETETDEQESKKKRRRQKKGGKKESSDTAASEVVAKDEDQTNAKAAEPIVDAVEPVTAKRSRKKKGKKVKKTDGESEATEATGGANDDVEVDDAVVETKDEASAKKSKKKERKSSQKKSKKQKVEGVSSSRLASYGL